LGKTKTNFLILYYLKRQVLILLGRTRNYFTSSHLKINSSISLLAFMPFFAVAFSSGTPASGSVQNGVETSIKAFCDGQVYSVVTKENVVSEALKETPCFIGENDLVSPSLDTKLDGAPLDIYVKKATQVTVVDGENVIKTRSAYRNTEDILKQLNIQVFPEDKVTSELIISDFEEDGLGQKITITRNPSVILEADGNVLEVRTSQNTVDDFLKEKGIVLGPKDELTPSPQTIITRGMRITVTRVIESDIQEEEIIPFETITKNDNNLLQGQGRVESEGVNGLKKKTSKVIYKNGVLAGKTTISEQILKAPKPKVVINGVRPYGAGDLWPLMVDAGAQWGIDPGKIYRVAQCESGANPMNNRNPLYKGMFQYLPSTWAGASSLYPGGRFRGASIFDPTAQIYVTAWKASKQGWRAWPVCGYR